MTDPEVERIAELCWRAHSELGWSWPEDATIPEHWRRVARAVIADRESQRSNRGATHWEGCWDSGPRHYECLRARLASQPPVTDGPALAEAIRERDEARREARRTAAECDRAVADARRERDAARTRAVTAERARDALLTAQKPPAVSSPAVAPAPTPALGPANDGRVFVIFDGPPSHESGRFVEVEDENGRGVNAGEWIHRLDGLWSLGPFYVRAQGPPVTAGPTLMDVVRERDRYAGALAACGVVARYGTRAVRPEYACDSLTAVSNLRTERDALCARLAEVERDRWGEHDAAERHFRQRDDAIRERDEALDRVDAAMRLVEVTRAEHDALAAAMPSDGADAALAYAAIRSEYDAYRKRTEEHMEREEKAVDLLTAERNSARRELDDAKRLLDGVTAERDALQSRLDALATREPTPCELRQTACIEDAEEVWRYVRDALLTAQESGEEGRAGVSIPPVPTAAAADQRAPAPASICEHGREIQDCPYIHDSAPAAEGLPAFTYCTRCMNLGVVQYPGVTTPCPSCGPACPHGKRAGDPPCIACALPAPEPAISAADTLVVELYRTRAERDEAHRNGAAHHDAAERYLRERDSAQREIAMLRARIESAQTFNDHYYDQSRTLTAERDALRARAIVAETRHAAESEHLISHGRSVERAAVVAWLHQIGAAPADVTSHSLHDAADSIERGDHLAAEEKP